MKKPWEIDICSRLAGKDSTSGAFEGPAASIFVWLEGVGRVLVVVCCQLNGSVLSQSQIEA